MKNKYKIYKPLILYKTDQFSNLYMWADKTRFDNQERVFKPTLYNKPFNKGGNNETKLNRPQITTLHIQPWELTRLNGRRLNVRSKHAFRRDRQFGMKRLVFYIFHCFSMIFNRKHNY
jgi:hypothetical protein